MLRTFVGLGGAALLSWSMGAYSFEVVIQGQTIRPTEDSETCIDVAGEYPGVRIEASEAGKTALICYSDAKEDILNLRNVTFVSTEAFPTASEAVTHDAPRPQPEKKLSGSTNTGDITHPPEVIIEFNHTFPPGPNGLIMARAKIVGFFSTASGVGVATGDTIHYSGIFSQAGHEDLIAEPFEHQVTEELDSALFESKGKKHYLIAGQRTLKARLAFSFASPGHKLTLTKGASVSIDTGSRFEDKLEEMEMGSEQLLEEQGKEAAPPDQEPSLEEELTF